MSWGVISSRAACTEAEVDDDDDDGGVFEVRVWGSDARAIEASDVAVRVRPGRGG